MICDCDDDFPTGPLQAEHNFGLCQVGPFILDAKVRQVAESTGPEASRTDRSESADRDLFISGVELRGRHWHLTNRPYRSTVVGICARSQQISSLTSISSSLVPSIPVPVPGTVVLRCVQRSPPTGPRLTDHPRHQVTE